MAKIIKTDTWHFKAFDFMLPTDRDDRAKKLQNLTTCSYWRTVLFVFPIFAATLSVFAVVFSPLLLLIWVCERPAIAGKFQGWNKKVDAKLDELRICQFATFDREVR